MLWLLPFLCSGAICWLNRERIGGAIAPPPMPRPAFNMAAFAPAPYLALPQTAGYRNTPYGVGNLLLAPAASPFAYPEGNPSPYMEPEASPPTVPTAPIALLRCSADGCMIRPEPRPWDDATLGRMPGAFTAPKDFPVYVLSYGPEGWARVLVNHPEDGSVEGWIETRSLTDAPIVASPPAPSATPAPRSSATDPTAAETMSTAIARHQQFMSRQRPGAAPSPPQRR